MNSCYTQNDILEIYFKCIATPKCMGVGVALNGGTLSTTVVSNTIENKHEIPLNGNSKEKEFVISCVIVLQVIMYHMIYIRCNVILKRGAYLIFFSFSHYRISRGMI